MIVRVQCFEEGLTSTCASTVCEAIARSDVAPPGIETSSEIRNALVLSFYRSTDTVNNFKKLSIITLKVFLFEPLYMDCDYLFYCTVSIN